MATTTVNVPIPDGAAVLVAENVKSVVLQLLSDGPLRLYVGPSAPSDASVGIMLTVRDFPAMSFFDLDPATDKVYAYCIDGGSENLAVVKAT
jgi:hypothetical protein